MQEQQPKGLRYLIFTVVGERFGFYALQTMLILYMTKALLIPEGKAFLVYGTFTSMLFLAAVMGGYFAERYLGSVKAVIIGGCLLVLGYCVLASVPLFLWGLSMVIVGNGLFTPNIFKLVRELFKSTDTRREKGFSLFYISVHVGAFIPPLFLGWAIRYYGWEAGFFGAAVAVAMSVIAFITGRRFLRGLASLSLGKEMSARFYLLFSAGLLASIGVFHLLFKFPREANLIITFAILPALLTVVIFLLKENRDQRTKMLGCLLLIVVSIGFWALHSQTFTSLMLYADKNMGKQFLGMTLDAELTRFFNPFFILLLAPLLDRLWSFLESKRKNPSIVSKFSLGVLCMSLGFFILGGAGIFFGNNGEVAAGWLVTSFFMQTLGELFLIPIALAMISALAAKNLAGLMMGLWFLVQAAAFSIGAELATYAAVPLHATISESLQIYDSAFILYGTIALGLSALSFVLVPFYKKLTQSLSSISS